jgi:hypothetical protein
MSKSLEIVFVANGSILKSPDPSPYLTYVQNQTVLNLSRHHTINLMSLKSSQTTNKIWSRYKFQGDIMFFKKYWDEMMTYWINLDFTA